MVRLSSLVVPSKWRNVLAAVVAAVLTTFTFLVFFNERRREEQSLQADLEIHAVVRAEKILKEIEEYLETLAFLAEWYRVELLGGREAVSPTLTTLVRVLLARNQDLYLFAEARPSAAGTGGIPAYSVAWVEPEGVRPLVVGSDLQRHPIFSSLLPRAIQSRHLEVSTRVPCPEKEGAGYDIWFLQPLLPHVYEEGSLAERSAPVGMLIAVLDIEDTMERTLNEMRPADLAWRLTDESAPPGEEILYSSGKPAAPAGGGHVWQTSFPLTSRNSWQLSATPGPLFVDAHLRRQSWWLLAGGLSFSLLVGGLLVVLANQTELVESQVRERTESLSREIAERLQVESRLRESEGKYRALAENAEDLIYVMGLDEKVLYANAYAACTVGVRPEALVGAPITSFAPDLSREQMNAMMAEIIAGRTIQQAFPVVFQGRSYWYDLHIVPLKNGAQQVTGILAIGRDITTRKELECQLQKAKEAAEAAAKGEFLATMSHEIRTPLNGVIGTIGLLLDGPLGEKQRELAGIAHESANILLALINDILDFSKIEAQRLEIEPIPFALSHLLEEVAALYAANAASKGLELVVSAAADVPQRVIGDAGRIRQVLLNLVGNAVKFTERGRITLGVASEGMTDGAAGLRFFVQDTGCGVAAGQQQRLFERFVQGDASTTRRHGGTGLGLAISRKLVELMGGQIGIESGPGEGATFWFRLALPPDSHPSPLPPAPVDLAEPRPRAAVRPCRVLVAEDNAINQRVAVLVLESLGCRADVAANGAEAVAMAQGFPYDLVLMDCEMPEMDGFAATREIRRGEAGGERHLPIVAMTARATEGDRGRCLQSGMDDYLSKPVSARQIAGMLARFIPQRGSATVVDAAPGPEPLHDANIPGELQPALDPRRSAELRRLSGSRDRWEQLALLFEKGVDAQLVRLRERCEAGDVDAVRSVVHKLKGSCVNFGAQGMADCCSQLEEIARGSSLEGAAAITAEVEAAWVRVQSALAEQRLRWGERSA